MHLQTRRKSVKPGLTCFSQTHTSQFELYLRHLLGSCEEHGRKTVMFSKQVKSCQFEQDGKRTFQLLQTMFMGVYNALNPDALWELKGSSLISQHHHSSVLQSYKDSVTVRESQPTALNTERHFKGNTLSASVMSRLQSILPSIPHSSRCKPVPAGG